MSGSFDSVSDGSLGQGGAYGNFNGGGKSLSSLFHPVTTFTSIICIFILRALTDAVQEEAEATMEVGPDEMQQALEDHPSSTPTKLQWSPTLKG